MTQRLATLPGAQISVPYRVAGKGRIADSCLSELCPVLYLTAERAPEILAAQGDGGPGCCAAGQVPGEGDGGRRAAATARAAFTLALGLVRGP